MKVPVKILSIALLFAAAHCSTQQEQITDIIKPVNLTAGIRDSVLVSDMFYASKYNLEITTNKNVQVNYNHAKKMIYFAPNMNFSGMTLINFNFDVLSD